MDGGVAVVGVADGVVTCESEALAEGGVEPAIPLSPALGVELGESLGLAVGLVVGLLLGLVVGEALGEADVSVGDGVAQSAGSAEGVAEPLASFAAEPPEPVEPPEPAVEPSVAATDADALTVGEQVESPGAAAPVDAWAGIVKIAPIATVPVATAPSMLIARPA